MRSDIRPEDVYSGPVTPVSSSSGRVKKWLPAGSFSLFLVTFFLPFVVLTCAGRPVEKELTGMDLLIQPAPDTTVVTEYPMELQGTAISSQKDHWLQFIVGLAITAGIAGLIIALSRYEKKKKDLYMAVSGTVSAVALMVLFVYIKSRILRNGTWLEGSYYYQMKTRPGYWLSFLIAVFHSVYYFISYRKGTANTAEKEEENADWPTV